MAEPFSIASAALGVASAGFQLVQTLYLYINAFSKAEEQLRPVAEHVKLTSAVLQSVGRFLNEDEIRKIYTPDLLSSTHEALDGCDKAFKQVEKFITALFRP